MIDETAWVSCAKTFTSIDNKPFFALITDLWVIQVALLALWDATLKVFARASIFIFVESLLALVALVPARFTAVGTVINSAVVADGIPLYILILKAADLYNRAHGCTKASNADSEP